MVRVITLAILIGTSYGPAVDLYKSISAGSLWGVKEAAIDLATPTAVHVGVAAVDAMERAEEADYAQVRCDPSAPVACPPVKAQPSSITPPLVTFGA